LISIINPIAQSEAALKKKPWVKYWLHNAFLTTEGEKVSKSKGGLYTISELEDIGYDPMAFRYMCLLTHYRKNLDFSLENLDFIKKSYQNVKNRIAETDPKAPGKPAAKYLKSFNEAINDDLNTPLAMQALQGLLKSEVSGKEKIDAIKKMDTVLGLDLLKVERPAFPGNIVKLVKQRENARTNKDWKRSDLVRSQIERLGYGVDDTDQGPKLRKL